MTVLFDDRSDDELLLIFEPMMENVNRLTCQHTINASGSTAVEPR